MTTTLTALREAMTEHLVSHGIRALSAWPETGRLVRSAPLAVVRMKGVEAEPMGFSDYLGRPGTRRPDSGGSGTDSISP